MKKFIFLLVFFQSFSVFAQQNGGNLQRGSYWYKNSVGTILTNSSDNVGINSTNPGSKLDVGGGDVRIATGGTFNNTSATEDLYVEGNVEVDGFLYGDGSNLTGISSPWTSTTGNVYPTTITDNIGIGTLTPSAELEIESTAANDLFLVSDNGPGDTTPFVIAADGNVGIGEATPRTLFDVSDQFTVNGDGTIRWGAGSGTDYGILNWDTNLAYVGGDTNAALSLLTNNSEKIRILTGGNVGIGSSAPGQELDVAGDVHVGAGSVSIPSYGTTTDRDTGVYFPAANTVGVTTGGVETIRFEGANVGIGTTRTNIAQFMVHQTGGATSILLSSDVAGTDNGISFRRQGADTANWYNRNNDFRFENFNSDAKFVFGTAATPANVGINTAQPSNRLGVMGAAAIGTAAYTGTAAPANGLLVEGNVGIGTLAPGTALDVTGTIRASTGTAGQATCWKADKSLGQCTSVVGAGGACTCS